MSSRPHALSVGAASEMHKQQQQQLAGEGAAQAPRRPAPKQRQDSKRNSNVQIRSAPSALKPASRRFGWKLYVLVLLALVAIGTFIVLRTAVHFFGTHKVDFITIDDIAPFRHIDALPYNPELSPSQALEEERELGVPREKIPRIVHQTWKTDVLPEKWDRIRKDCMEMLPDFDFKLWSDDSARAFIAQDYPGFLPTWDSYPYNIQRADAIRYFVLHRYGGIYMDLDIGCRAHPGPLLHYESILPVTKPVGLSNDLMFSAPKTPFMDLVVNSLETFNHEWLYMPYPTVMFSTGPMFISAIYSMWCRILDRGVGIDPAKQHLYKRVKILPKSLYGKNILPELAPDSFFYHYYGSSWHAGDAGFIGFLGKYGYGILLGGTSLILAGFCYMIWSKRHYVLPTPRMRKISLDPFEDFTTAPLSPHDPSDPLTTSHRSSKSFKKRVASFANYFHRANDHVPPAAYSPLATRPPISASGMRQRSNTVDSDSMSLHSIHAANSAATSSSQQPPKRKQRAPPLSSRPHGRQKSRDIERGSPLTPSIYSSSSINGSVPWLWPEQGSSAIQTQPDVIAMSPPALSPNRAPNGGTSYFPTFSQTSPQFERTSASPPAMRVTAPSASTTPRQSRSGQPKRPRSNRGRMQKSTGTSSSSSSGTSSPVPRSSGTAGTNGVRTVSPGRLKAPSNGLPYSHERTASGGTTDGDVSASELMDRLTDLAPVAVSSARPGANTPRERDRESQYMMRKRSLSSEGERFQEQ